MNNTNSIILTDDSFRNDGPSPEQVAFANAVLALYAPDTSRFNVARNGSIYMKKTKDKTMPESLKRGHLYHHFKHTYAVCIFGQADGSRFTCFDVDSGGWELASLAIDALTGMGIPRDDIHISTSGGKGYHIEIFYDELIDYALQHRIYGELLRRTQTDTHQIELRPTYTQSIKLPLSKHHKTGNMCWFLDRETGEEIQDSAYLTHVQPIPKATIDAIAAALPEIRPDVRERIYDSEYSVPVDLHCLPRIEEPGTRHKRIMQIGITLFNHGFLRDAAENTLLEWYEDQAEEISSTPYREGLKDITDTVNWIYTKYVPGKHEDYHITSWITYTDVLSLLSLRGISARALLFDVLTWQHLNGRCHSTLEYLSHATGISYLSCRKARRKLEDLGILSVKLGKSHCHDGDFSRDHSVVQVNRWPDPVSLPEEAWLQEVYRFNPLDLKENFWRIYFDALFTLADRKAVLPHLCKRERDILAEIEKGGEAA